MTKLAHAGVITNLTGPARPAGSAGFVVRRGRHFGNGHPSETLGQFEHMDQGTDGTSSARAHGRVVDAVATPGSIPIWSNGRIGPVGHVGYVDDVYRTTSAGGLTGGASQLDPPFIPAAA